MPTIRPAGARGHADHGWLDTRHTFSFAEYHDPAHTHFRKLRVLNEDRVKPGEGFGTHPHQDMEILTWVLQGALAHRDSTGGEGIIRPGEIQRMSAGTGVTHSEYNGSRSEPVHFLQMWIFPDRKGQAPGYEQATLPDAALRNRFALAAGPAGSGAATVIHQDATLSIARLDAGKSVRHAFAPGRAGWLHLARGEAEANGLKLGAGDGLRIEDEPALLIASAGDTEILLFDLG